MKLAELEACDLSAWYPLYASLTPRTVSIELPEEVVAYLRDSEGLRLPSDLPASPQAHALRRWSERVDAELASLGGSAFPKLNWSSPRDAAWILPGHSLRITCADDLLLALKASEFVAHDLSRALPSAEDWSPSTSAAFVFRLHLREWAEERIRPATELRLFLKKRRLIAASQRHCEQSFPSLVAESEAILEEAGTFVEEEIGPLLPAALWNGVVTDVFYTVDEGRRRWALLDLNVWSGATDSLLWDWAELEQMAESARPQLRLAPSGGVRTSSYAAYSEPADVRLLGAAGIAQLMQQAQADDDAPSSDEEEPVEE